MQRVTAFRLALWLLVMALVLASFAVYVLGCVSSSPRGPATVSSGPVTIGLDHSIYAPDDTITITVMNQSQKPIDLSRQIPGNCLPYYVMPHNATAVDPSDQFCNSSEANLGFNGEPLDPGFSTQFVLDHEARDTFHVALQPGTYVVNIPYVIVVIVAGRERIIGGNDTTSQPFRICTCATCS